jgi:hypothetical protein
MKALQFSDPRAHTREFTKTKDFTPPKCLLKGSNLLLMLAVFINFWRLILSAGGKI